MSGKDVGSSRAINSGSAGYAEQFFKDSVSDRIRPLLIVNSVSQEKALTD